MKQTLSEIYNLLNQLTVTGFNNNRILVVAEEKLKQVYNELTECEKELEQTKVLLKDNPLPEEGDNDERT